MPSLDALGDESCAGPVMNMEPDRTANEIKEFSGHAQAHPLPEIFHFWSNSMLRPRVDSVFPERGQGQIFAGVIREALQRADVPRRIISLGSGACRLELAVAGALVEGGVTDFVFECVDLTASRIDAARQAAMEAGQSERFVFTEEDVNRWRPRQQYAAVMAAQSLHHFVELEHIFQAISDALHDNGMFVTADMIGCNGHQRWPEAMVAINALWEVLPEKYKYNHAFKCIEDVYVNRDYSRKGFEGIRAQDILPLLQRFFHFERFVAFGNIIDPFVSRAFGPNFSRDVEFDREFVRRLDRLNDWLIDDDLVKPTQMRAAMTKHPVAQTHVYRHWTPAFCTRWPDADYSAKTPDILEHVRSLF